MLTIIQLLRAKSTGGDMWGHIGMLPPSCECPDCGRPRRLFLKATDKPMTVQEIEIIRSYG